MYFFLFILGLAVGSFLNVISLRYLPGRQRPASPAKRGERASPRAGNRILDLKIISGRSQCLNCQKKLAWYELVPIISFIIQKGRCRSCGKRLFWQYPVVEILSGLIFVFVPLYFLSASISVLSVLISVLWILIFLIFLLLSIIDFRHYIIPNQINLSLAFLGILIIIGKSFNLSIFQSSNLSFLGSYAYLFGPTWLFGNVWLNHLIAAVFGIAIFWLIIFLSKGKAMGWGDLKLAGVLGLIFGWPDIIMVLMLSFLVGGIFSTILLIKGKKKLKDVVPFGPFLIIGATLTFFFGYQIISAYFKLFNL